MLKRPSFLFFFFKRFPSLFFYELFPSREASVAGVLLGDFERASANVAVHVVHRASPSE